MKQFAGKGMGDRMRMAQQLQNSGMLDPGARMAKTKQGTGKRLSAKDRAKAKKQREREMRRKKREQRGGGEVRAKGP